MNIRKGFASDNWSGVCPGIMEALSDVNRGHIQAYGEGEEEITIKAREKFKKHFGVSAEVFFVYNGTAANVLGIGHLLRSYQGIVTAHTAHINEDECGAPEKSTGSKILQIDSDNGKITPDQVKPFLSSVGFQHHSQPKIISISQVSELGTVYTVEEIKALSDFAHNNNMYLHMDGARISNAAVALNMDFRSFTVDAGVDVLSFGGTKNGLMFGEAVVFFNKELSNEFEYTRKQGMQLHSKMRFISAQFDRYLTDELWKKNAQTANNMAQYLAEKIRYIPDLIISQKTEANGVFVIMPEDLIPKLQKRYFFHVWNESPVINGFESYSHKEVRLMCSWDTSKDDIDEFVSLI